MVKKLHLQNGYFALVDDQDFDRTNEFNWIVKNASNGKSLTVIRTDKQSCSLGRFLLDLNSGDKTLVTHKNGDILDFRRINLVVVSRNKGNHFSKANGKSTSKYKGVCWDKYRSKWAAAIRVDGRKKHLGRFGNEDDAAKAYNSAVIKYRNGEGYLNVIGEDNTTNTNIKLTPRVPSQLRKSKNKKSSIYLGVSYNNAESKFAARIYFKKQFIHLKYHIDEIEAAKAYDIKAYELYGEQAILNFPELRNEYMKELNSMSTYVRK
ncbi:AP2 domain-containing protein [Viridibacillus arvi]|uniref:AP2 domain-containing protein n=1 Tax=Viridibacillus arvi TaxID=263475 RepID=UPI0034CF1014